MTAKRGSKRLRALDGNFMLAPMVAMMRLPIMAGEAGSRTPWSGETARAVSEKAVATAEGLFAAQMSMMGSIAAFWPEIMAGRTPSVLNGVAVERSVQAALAPAGRAVKANFRRLSSRS